MTPGQIALVQESWKRLQPIADQAAELFYARLFGLEPSVRPLFRGDRKEQGRKFMAMISLAVSALARPGSIAPAVRALGRRHAGYGVEERHHAVVEAALLWSLKQCLGARFTQETEHAWRAAYGVLATTMKQTTREASPCK